MGLLDQVLGQVIGGLAGGGSSQTAPGGRAPTGGGMTLPAGLNLPGGLGDLLSGNRGKIAMAVLALLASKHLQSGAGGYGSILHDMFAGGSTGAGSGSSGTSGSVASSRGGSGGGFLDQVGGMLDGSGGRSGQSQAGSGGGLGGALGGALGGGMLGGALGGGLNDLLERFRQNGQGGAVDSWVGHGPNQQISPQDLEGALGSSQVDDLAQHTGLGRDELLQELSGTLPQVVDGLTPHGRQPSQDDTTQWV